MHSRRIELLSLSALVVVVLAVAFGLHSGRFALAAGPAAPDSPATLAAIPSTFNYQGTLRLADGSLANDSYNITLKIYDAAVGGNVLHSESFANVNVRDGQFKVVVGDSVAIGPTVFSDAPRFVGITVAPDPEMVPRQRLHPVPWAQQATTAVNATNATNAVNATTATTLVQNAVVPGLRMTGYNVLRIDGPPDPQFAPYISLGGNGSFAIDSPGVVGGRFWVSQNGNVGIGDPNPTQLLSVNGQVTARGGVYTPSNITADGYVSSIGNIVTQGKVYATHGFNGKCVEGSWNPGVVGNNINVTCNQDVAETFASAEPTEPGDLVVLLPETRERPTVRRTASANETGLVGVVSTNPGLVFDQGQTYLAGENANLITADKTVVAVIGRVPVKVSLENGPIAVGDPLTSGSVAGAAMKATQAGQILGYAMQSSDEMQDGKLLAWLQLGYYMPSPLVSALNDGATSAQAVAALTEQNSQLAQQVAALQTENAASQEQLATMNARLAALERGGQSASLPVGWPLVGGLVVVGLLLGARGRRLL